MTKTETSPTIAFQTQQSIPLTPVEGIQTSLEGMHEARDRFVGELVVAGSVSQEFADSGVLDKFMINPEAGSDAISHILVGDAQGGAHHMRTIDELGMEGSRIFASRIHDPENPRKPLKRFRKSQKILPDGSFRCDEVTIDCGQGPKKKIGGSVMFPEEWTAQDVLSAAAGVSEAPSIKYDAERQSNIHTGVVRGVPIRVVTSSRTNQIITASVNRIQHG